MLDAPRNPWLTITGGTAGPGYAARFAEIAAAGADLHGEADRVHGLLPGPSTVLDAGCGTGRVARRLAGLGHRTVGVDLDASMLDEARAASPELRWVLADLADPGVEIGEAFDAVVTAGNLWPLLTPGTHAVVVTRLATLLRPGGMLVSGFGLDAGHVPFALPEDVPFPGIEEYDDAAGAAGLTLRTRSADWAGHEPFENGGYVVSVHEAGA